MPEQHEIPATGEGNAGIPSADQLVNGSDDNGTAGLAQAPLRNLPPAYLTEAEEERRQILRQAALSYQNRGWRVIPVHWVDDEGRCSCGDDDCRSRGKHPVHARWPEIASASFDVVADWWGPPPSGSTTMTDWHPRANVGVVTGAYSGIFVLDVDPEHDGETTLAAYVRDHGELPATRIHQTGGGGLHYIFAHPGFPVRNSAGKTLGAGLDIRGDNGFIVVPPSWSDKGQYTISAVHEVPVLASPDWLLGVLREHDRRQLGDVVWGTEPSAGTGYGRRYAQAALEAEADRVRNAESGTRNNTLNEAAFSLGTLGAVGLIEEEEAWAALEEAAGAAGLGKDETRKTFLSGWRSGLENPRQVQWRAMPGSWPMRDRTEFGLADRMVDHYADELRWCPELHTWMIYSEGYWKRSFPETGYAYAQQMIRRLYQTEALEYDDEHTDPEVPSPRDDFLAWVSKQYKRAAVTNSAELAKGRPTMVIRESTFDLDSMLLNVRNGIVDLRTGLIQPHSPEQRMTMQCPVIYDPGAEAPRFQEFLRRVQPDSGQREWLQVIIGYTLTGKISEQAIFFHYGLGANGKSVFHDVMMAIMGSYAQAMPVETLLASKAEGRIPNDVARMKGRRYLQASEAKEGRRLDEQMIKQLTGGDTIAARFLRAEYFEFKPVGKIHLITNHLPAASDDHATWRRVHVLTWNEVIPDEEQDLDLADYIILNELSGVLAWAVRGAVSWTSDGLKITEQAQRDKDAYRQAEDVLGVFVSECLTIVPSKIKRVGSSSQEIYNLARNWYISNGYQPLSQKNITKRLKDRGYEYVNAGGWRGFTTLLQRSLQDSPLPAD